MPEATPKRVTFRYGKNNTAVISNCNSEASFDLSANRLPENFYGHNPEELITKLKNRASLTKDEFETTKQFNERVENANKLPLIGSLSLESLYVFNITPDLKYDADSEIMTATKDVEAIFSLHNFCQDKTYRILLDYQKLKYTFLKKEISIELAKAKEAKPNISLLLITTLKPPYLVGDRYTDSARLSLVLNGFWIYNTKTGEIYSKLNSASDFSTRFGNYPEIEALIDSYKYDEALTKIRAILSEIPMEAEAYYLLGRVNSARKDSEQAIRSFKTALFWDNRMIQAHIELSRIYFESGNCAQSNDYYQTAFILDSGNPELVKLKDKIKSCLR